MELNPSLCEPPYTRPAWFILSEAEGFGGVRGAVRQLLADPSTRLYTVYILIINIPQIALNTSNNPFKIISCLILALLINEIEIVITIIEKTVVGIIEN